MLPFKGLHTYIGQSLIYACMMSLHKLLLSCFLYKNAKHERITESVSVPSYVSIPKLKKNFTESVNIEKYLSNLFSVRIDTT
jgi:hypothetical protein